MLECVYEPAHWCNAQLMDIECTNLSCHIAQPTKCCTVVPNVCGSSECNVFHVTLLVSRILRWLLDFSKVCSPYIKCLSNEDKIIQFNTRQIYVGFMVDTLALPLLLIFACQYHYSNVPHSHLLCLLWTLHNISNCQCC
jgi:hypothetical protein